MSSVYVKSVTLGHIQWRMIVVLTYNPNVSVFMDIKEAPQL